MGNPLKARLKTTLVGLAQRRGWELTPAWKVPARPLVQHLAALFGLYRIDGVLDVGANLGQYHDLIRDHVGFEGPIASFEPVERYVAHLRQRCASDSRWFIEPYALGRAPAQAEIHLTRSPGMNSFLAPRDDVVSEVWAGNPVIGTERVTIDTLDAVFDGVCAKMGARRLYLKLDTQGFDLEALRGAEQSLRAVCALQIEASVRPTYHGMPDYRECIAHLQSRGFDLSTMFPIAFDDGLRLVEFDCVFVNRSFADGLR